VVHTHTRARLRDTRCYINVRSNANIVSLIYRTEVLSLFNGPSSETTRLSQYQKGKTNLDFTEARDSKWQWHQLCHIQVCTSLLTDNHASTPPLGFLQAGCPSSHPTNSVKALVLHLYIVCLLWGLLFLTGY